MDRLRKLAFIALICWVLALVPADRTSRQISLMLLALGVLAGLKRHWKYALVALPLGVLLISTVFRV